jgi:hypothetical protein
MLIFASTVFLSAFLLFQVQPIVAKMILPWFGGSSSVWSVCMVFFQAALLIGYAYVHWLHERFTARQQVMVHGGLLLLSLVMLPMAADPSWKGMGQANPSWSVLMVLTILVGAPYLMLSTTGPLMQAWYVRAFSTDAGNSRAYRLYALSNLASMIALLSYPIVIEPVFGVGIQANLWSAGYAAFVALALATAAMVWRSHAGPEIKKQATRVNVPRPALAECLIWVGLGATASTLLLTLTRQLTADVAPVPFLWVLPLAIYLLSFILCFDAPRYYVRPLFLSALPVSFFAIDRALAADLGIPALVTIICASLFVFCMVCHGELVRRKPHVRHLTLFYLMLSIGGALGGALVGLVAPVVFTSYFELPIGLFACAALTVIVTWREIHKPLWRAALILALVGYGWRLGEISMGEVRGYRVTVRNFYSQLKVRDTVHSTQGPKRAMYHGIIVHGEQLLGDDGRGRTPTAYYCEQSGIGRAIRGLPQDRPLKIGIVGLGAGTLATYGRAGDDLRIYEINDQVLDLARDEFTYLKDTPAKVTQVLGDGRLMLEREPQQHFDLLAMDAFSGDSIPTHLLTLEAMKTYIGHLQPDGILAVHVTNHYLNLLPVMAAIAQHFGKVALKYEMDPGDQDKYCRNSIWVMIMSPDRATHLPDQLKGGIPLKAQEGFKPWTDGFSNLLSVLK